MTDYLNTTQHTVAWLRKAESEGTLDVAPPFQRNPVWTTPQKAFLIDTLLRAYPVPEIYMQDSVDQHGTERHIVVDGQQRIRACLEFIDGQFPLLEEHTPEYAGLKFSGLPPEAKTRIFQYKFIVRLLPEMPVEELRAIFGRLNRNVIALNAQELRHATYWGAFIRQMESLADDSYWAGTGIFSPTDVRRMLDVEYVSELTIAALHGPQTKKASLDQWYEIYEETYEEERSVAELFRTLLAELDVVLPNIRNTRWRKKSDFYSLFGLLSARRDRLPFAREERDVMKRQLEGFGAEVDRFLSDPEADVSVRAKRYAAAVERAATDVANRRTRLRELDRTLVDAWPDAEPLFPDPPADEGGGDADPSEDIAIIVADADSEATETTDTSDRD
jgi:Protein of unknown function DUF262